MNKSIASVRQTLANNGSTELSVQKGMPGMDQIWQNIQDLRSEMNKAKKQAAEDAAKPFLEKIAELEEQYSMILKLSS
jgi:hypothetical protein